MGQEKDLGEIGKAIGHDLSEFAQTLSRMVDQNSRRLIDFAKNSTYRVDKILLNDLAEMKTKWVSEVKDLSDRIHKEFDVILDRDQKETESMNKGRLLTFGSPIQVHGREGFFIGRFSDPTDPSRPYSTTQYQVALSSPSKAYVTVVTMPEITVKV